MSACITNIRIKDGILQYTVDGCHYVSVGQVGGSDGQDGQDGQNGQNGVTPHINQDNKHWMIGDIDTGIVAEGADGSTISIDQNGYWVIDGETTQYKAAGDVYNINAVHGEETGTGVPSVTRTIDPTTKTATFTFSNLKGDKGDTPVFTVEEGDDGYDLYVDDTFLCTLNHGEKGEDGSTGATGPQGPAGTGITWKKDAASCTNTNDGYIDEDGYLYVLTSATGVTPKVFVDYGCLKGPQGSTGEQGSMWYLKDSFVPIPNSTSLDFEITGSRVGDLVIYSGASNYKATQGDVFKLSSISNDTQYWLYQNFNINGTGGNGFDEDFESLVTKLRGYPLYSQGDGIDIVPNDEGYYTIKALVDNNTIKFDSEGRMYATGGGAEEYGAVLNFVRTNTSSSISYPEVRDITQQYFNIKYDPVTGYSRLVYSPFTDSDLASKLLNGKIKKATIVVASIDASGGNYRAFLPASVLLSNDNSCLIIGWGFQSELGYALGGHRTDSSNYEEMYARDFGGGISPALYCIHLKYDDTGYYYGGFVIETDSSVGIWGHT